VPHYPVVDPRGLVTPLFDGWSLDFWLLGADGPLLPSKSSDATQSLDLGENIAVRTQVRRGPESIASRVWMERDERGAWCVVEVSAEASKNARLVITARPYNPEGVSFIDAVSLASDRRSWTINGTDTVEFNRAPLTTVLACYKTGDVFHALDSEAERSEIECKVGMATAAAVFSSRTPVEVRIPIATEDLALAGSATRSWREELETCAQLRIPDERLQRLWDIAVGTVILHSPSEVFPGPYTYKRFWYRDAALILNSLITLGGRKRTRRALDLFPRGQLRDGYFRSQEGEWDSNGQVLWILDRYVALTGEPVPAGWWPVIERGARWIVEKRMSSGSPHPGLLPAGFSAEHLGPNDFYYWDDFWGVAGLRAASRLLQGVNAVAAREFDEAAAEFMQTIVASIERGLPRTKGAIPAAPDRRMDSGAVGSIVADFPLQLLPPGDERMRNTIEWLLAGSFVRGGFFQNMIHSGINAYLTLHVAQVLLRAGDSRAHELIDAVATLASPTGQWPEAIHPRTLGGCMGDGQHVWAAAEWLMMMRNLFVREEDGTLIVGSGIRRAWMENSKPFGLERTLTPFGEVSVRILPLTANESDLSIQGEWRGQPPQFDVRVPGYSAMAINNQTFRMRRNA
jgi:hypothetical protein